MPALPEIPAHSNMGGVCSSCGVLVRSHFVNGRKLTCEQLGMSLRKPAQSKPAAEKREPLDISGWALVGVVTSDSDPNTVYELRQEPDGDRRIGCTCPGWTNRWTCKHVDRFRQAQQATL